MYDKIEELESLLIAARAKKQAIEAEKLTGDNIYKVLIYFDQLYGKMNDREKRQLIEELISEIQIYPERQPNGQWLKSIKFRLPIIEEDMNISLDNEQQVDACRYAAVCEQNHKERLAARRAKEDLWVWLARLSLEIFVFQGHPLQGLPDDLPDELTKQTAGAFVSLHKDDRLRGCLGTISPTWEITAMGIVQNAISAGTRDPQFPPVRAGEPDELEYRRAGQARVGGLSRPAEPEAIRRYCQLREQARAAAGSGWSGHGGTTAGDCPAEGQYRGGRALYHPTFPGGATHMSAECTLCFHRCILREGQTGLCRVRTNWGDSIIPLNYGKLTALALDPIEKKNRRAAFIPVT